MPDSVGLEVSGGSVVPAMEMELERLIYLSNQVARGKPKESMGKLTAEESASWDRMEAEQVEMTSRGILLEIQSEMPDFA